VARDILCRATVGLLDPRTGKSVRAGSFVTVDPDDPDFGALIGVYLIPADRKGRDLPTDRWPGAREKAEAETAAAPAPLEHTPEDAQEPPEDAAASPSDSTLTIPE
jgi:hypothetical protein